MATATLEARKGRSTTSQAAASAKRALRGLPGAPQEHRGRALLDRGSEVAGDYLRSRGFEIVETDWESSAGYVDIVAKDGDVLVLVDIKLQVDPSQGFPSDRIDQEKRERYERKAIAYIAEHDELRAVTLRVDTLTVLFLDDRRMLIRHHVNAIGAA